ncbi:MAG: hypothetical protein LBJ24_06930 [Treponema sp.]|jgi:hypothetical protein|nr:hypothetical protein [Treponema sp.]
MSFLDRYDSETVESAREAAGFIQFPAGEHPARIIGVVEKTSTTGKDMLEVTFGDESGAQIRDYIVDGEWAAGKLKNLQTSFGIPYGERDIRRWIGKAGIIVVKEGEPYNGVVYNKVSHCRSAKTAAGAPAASSPAGTAGQAPREAAGAPAGEAAKPARDIPF